MTRRRADASLLSRWENQVEYLQHAWCCRMQLALSLSLLYLGNFCDEVARRYHDLGLEGLWEDAWADRGRFLPVTRSMPLMSNSGVDGQIRAPKRGKRRLRGAFCAPFQNQASLRGRESEAAMGWSWNSWGLHVEGRAGWRLAAAVVALVGRSNRFPQAFGESIAATKAGENLDKLD